MIAHYRTGSKPIPLLVGLACKGWEASTFKPVDKNIEAVFRVLRKKMLGR